MEIPTLRSAASSATAVRAAGMRGHAALGGLLWDNCDGTAQCGCIEVLQQQQSGWHQCCRQGATYEVTAATCCVGLAAGAARVLDIYVLRRVNALGLQHGHCVPFHYQIGHLALNELNMLPEAEPGFPRHPIRVNLNHSVHQSDAKNIF